MDAFDRAIGKGKKPKDRSAPFRVIVRKGKPIKDKFDRAIDQFHKGKR